MSSVDARNAVVLLSGGMDSATTLAIAREQGFGCHALSFDYGQRHRFELEAASRVARKIGVREHIVMKIDLRAFGGSALTADIDVPKGRFSPLPLGEEGPPIANECDWGPRSGVRDSLSRPILATTRVEPPSPQPSPRGRGSQQIPITYVPARNTIFLSLALAYAETRGARDIFIGVNAIDYSGYPDCRPEFIRAFQRMANLATRMGVERERITIHAPLIRLTKAQIIQRGITLGVDYALTFSCYDPDESGNPCGRCDACVLRAIGFREANVLDPMRM